MRMTRAAAALMHACTALARSLTSQTLASAKSLTPLPPPPAPAAGPPVVAAAAAAMPITSPATFENSSRTDACETCSPTSLQSGPWTLRGNRWYLLKKGLCATR